MSNDTEKSFDVTIFTHESADLPFEQTVVELLTHFFVGIQAPLQTYILADNLAKFTPQMTPLGNYLTLVDEDNNKRVCVSSTKQFEFKKSQVIFISCHGQNGRPAALSFHCSHNKTIEETDSQLVWANAHGRRTAPALYDIIKGCNLAIVLSCCGDEIIHQYTQDYQQKQNSLHFPDILVCNRPKLHSSTVEIFTVLLLNIMDSEITSIPPRQHVVYHTARTAITRIFQIVRLFSQPNDPAGFWDFLQSVGCITNNIEAKDIEQLRYPSQRLGDGIKHPRYRIAGSSYAWPLEKHPTEIFSEFQALQLFYKDDKLILVEDWNEVSDIELQSHRSIDLFLYAYQQGKQNHATQPHVDSQTTQSHLSLLLEKLQELHWH
jgi:hypothetical protein